MPTDNEAARAAIERLVNEYAAGADRRRYDAVAALFAENGRLAIFRGQPGTSTPRTDVRGRAKIEAELAVLDQFIATTHFLGQHTITFADHDTRGETYCLAHHVYASAVEKRITVMSIRYLDQFVQENDTWRIQERLLAVDWVEDRPLRINPTDQG